jgi:hypothetical protein
MVVGKRISVSRKPTAKENQDLVLYLNNLVLYHAMKLNYTAFIQKAQTGSDSFGDEWKPLAEKTLKWKQRKKILYSGRVAINIRTRELLQAMKPGYFRNGRYLPPPGQSVEVTTKSISVEIEVPYADAVDAVRPIFVLNLDSLLTEALNKALPLFYNYLRRKGFKGTPPVPPSFLDRMKEE